MFLLTLSFPYVTIECYADFSDFDKVYSYLSSKLSA